jgi:hypothetical protein
LIVAGAWFVFTFFRVVPPVTRPIAVCLWLAAAGGAAAIATGVATGAAALTPLLVLQIFAASSGFERSARRGYYDLLLSRGIGPSRVLAAHWLASIAPGLAAWLAVAAVERLTGSASPDALASGSLMALALVSSLPWAITTPLPRFAAAIGWLVLLVTSLAVVPSGQANLLAALRAPEPSPLGALALVAYPMGALGMPGSRLSVATVGPGLACALASVVIAILWHGRRGTPLESAP